jgi:uncharacterized integral membrane protein
MSDKGQTTSSTTDGDPLRGSRTSATWVAVSLLVVLMLLLVIFIAQNTQNVQVSFFGWSGEPPLAVALLIAATVGMVIAATAGALRILQLRRRVRRHR